VVQAVTLGDGQRELVRAQHPRLQQDALRSDPSGARLRDRGLDLLGAREPELQDHVGQKATAAPAARRGDPVRLLARARERDGLCVGFHRDRIDGCPKSP
jgi:hypothetical protein